MADYEHHIFISYRRMNPDWVKWTNKNLVRFLQSFLSPSLGRVSIFVDQQIETGSLWPARLAQAHARSRLLIPILCPDYFNSEWCRIELALMFEREKQQGFRTTKNPRGLILPVIINDGDRFPSAVQAIQGEKIHRFAQPYICEGSPLQEEFANHIKDWCPQIEEALDFVPQFDPLWESVNQEQFRETFRVAVLKQTTLPPLSLHPIPGSS